jgi:transcriptional regulator with XRE-family HTH domain
MATGSLVVRRSLGRQLKALRVAAGKSFAEVGEAQIASKAKLARIEAGQQAVKMPDVRALCWLYGVDEATTDQLAERALNTAEQGWWEPFGDVMPSWFTTYVELESAASTLHTYQSDLVPGLLQTPAYHQALFDADPLLQGLVDVERNVQFRVERQHAVFDRPGPLCMTAVLSEAVLARQVGGGKVMDEQRQHLLELSDRPNIVMHVVPFSAGAHAAMRGTFAVLGFDSPDDPAVTYLETRAGGRYIEEQGLLEAYRCDFAQITAQSIPIEEYLR